MFLAVIRILLFLLTGMHACALAADTVDDSVVPAASASLLVLLADDARLREALAAIAARQWAADELDGRRRAVSAARMASFIETEATRVARIRALLPATAQVSARIEPVAVFNVLLVHLPQHAAPAALAALEIARADAANGIAHVSLHPAGPPLPLDAASALPIAAGDDTAPEALDIALIDNGVDARHPLVTRAVRALDFGPGAPGVDGRLLRSHGTAMLGIYAQLARGERLVAGGVPQGQGLDSAPFTLAHALVARAGPETPAGRNDLVRDLAWLMSPDGRRPYPDIINYSQGNGALCAGPREVSCRGTRWFGVTRLIDRIIDEQAVVVVKSAGNRGYAAGTTMTVPGDTYNGITVGNMHAFDWRNCQPSADRARHKIYHTSSVAPLPGQGPRLLDLVAPGVRIRTAGVDPAWCRARCANDASTSCAFCPRLGRRQADTAGFWKTNSGTSPAAAVVGATAAGLMQAGTRAPAVIKAVLINSADAWTSAGLPAPHTRGDGRGCGDDRAAEAHGPYTHGARYDRSYGWGYMNAAAAMREHANARRDTIAPGERICYRVDLAAWDKLTLAWDRRVGACTDCAAPGWYPLRVLDLALFAAEAPWAELDRDRDADRRDNVRQVSNGRGGQARPAQMTALVRVSAAPDGSRDETPPSEPFALASRRPLTRLATCPAGLR